MMGSAMAIGPLAPKSIPRKAFTPKPGTKASMTWSAGGSWQGIISFSKRTSVAQVNGLHYSSTNVLNSSFSGLFLRNYDKYFMQALKVRRLITLDFEKVWNQGLDVLLTPVTLSAAPTYSDFTQLDSRTQTSVQDYCTQSPNMAGKPASLNSLNCTKWMEDAVQFPTFIKVNLIQSN